MTGMNASFDCIVVTHPKKGTTKSGKNSLSFIGEYVDFTGEKRRCWVNVHGPAANEADNLAFGDHVHVDGAVFSVAHNPQRPDAPTLSVNANRVTPIACGHQDHVIQR